MWTFWPGYLLLGFFVVSLIVVLSEKQDPPASCDHQGEDTPAHCVPDDVIDHLD